MSIVPFVVGYFAIQWNRANFLGKSPEQIVAMGREKWTDLYGNKVGQSTRDMCDAEEKYALALQNLNDRAIRRLPKTRQVWLQGVRKNTKEYAFEAHRIGEIVSGGGTIWRTFDAAIAPDVEEVISDCIVNKQMPMIKMKSFEAAMKELDIRIAESKETAGEQFSQIPKYRRAMTMAQGHLEKLIDHGNQNDATRIRVYMHKQIEAAKGQM